QSGGRRDVGVGWIGHPASICGPRDRSRKGGPPPGGARARRARSQLRKSRFPQPRCSVYSQRSPGAQEMTPPRPPSSSGTPWRLIAIVVVILIALFGAWRAGLLGGDGEIVPSHSGASPGTQPGLPADSGVAPPPVPPAPGVPPLDPSQAPPAEQEARAEA